MQSGQSASTRIPVSLDVAGVSASLRISPAKAERDGLAELVALAQNLIRPSALWAVAFVGTRAEGTVEVGGIIFESPLLRKHLEGTNRVFPYIITVGPGLEKEAAEHGDLLRQYYLEEIANIALEQAAGWLASHLEARFGVFGLSNLSPGSLADWPITEQPKLFSLFGDTERLVGVRLTDSMLMIPRKSISGILFPSEEGFVACQLCDREHCQGRKAPFKPTSP